MYGNTHAHTHTLKVSRVEFKINKKTPLRGSINSDY